LILKQARILEALHGQKEFKDDPLWIVPEPPEDELRDSGEASIDLRLGRWFLRLKHTRHPLLKISDEGETLNEGTLTERQFVRFGKEFILHPGSFVLGATLEWIKIPLQCAGSVVGKSSWGRRGLIIETAPTVHPGFSGCLTLEMTNVGEIPIELKPGMAICQLVLQKSDGPAGSAGSFHLMRRPALGSIRLDGVARALARRNTR
jgi:dCTP deaminase